MTYFKWQSVDSFKAWHASVAAGLGIPHPNENMATGEVDEAAQWTTAYTVAKVVAADDVRASVEDAIAESYPVGLGVPSEMPPEPDPFALSQI